MVIGIGNKLMMDDGIAIEVLENIKEKLEAKGIEVTLIETDPRFCFHQLKEDDFIIIVDATFTGNEPGSVSICNLQEIVSSYGETCSQHDISIFDLMRIYSKPVKGYFIGIEISEVKFGFEFSKALKAKFNDICNAVEKSIYELLEEITNA